MELAGLIVENTFLSIKSHGRSFDATGGTVQKFGLAHWMEFGTHRTDSQGPHPVLGRGARSTRPPCAHAGIVPIVPKDIQITTHSYC
jgi:hypothetical protein